MALPKRAFVRPIFHLSEFYPEPPQRLGQFIRAFAVTKLVPVEIA